MAEGEQAEPELSYKACVAVGVQYVAKGHLDVALEMFDRAAEMQEFDNLCRIARANCYLKMSRPKDALDDAGEALIEDADSIKAKLLKAEALYAIGEFEWSMVWFQRGLQKRPEILDFQAGVDKCSEAIINGVGSIKEIPMRPSLDTAFLREDGMAHLKKKPGKKGGGQTFVGAMAQKMQLMERKKKPEEKVKDSPRTCRQLLGELYSDRKYLEKLLGQGSLFENSPQKDELVQLAKDGADYLDSQTEFWRKQQPMYARSYEHKKRHKKKAPELTTNQLTQKFLEALVDIDNTLLDGTAEEALHKADRWLEKASAHSSYELPSKQEILANLWSSKGNALIDTEDLEGALRAHEEDMKISQKARSAEGTSRAMDNVGRTLAKLGRHREAIKVWKEKLPLSTMAAERAWLLHEIGRSYYDLEEFDKSLEMGDRARGAATEASDDVWIMNALVLMGQSLSKLDMVQDSLDVFKNAMEISEQLNEAVSSEAIRLAMADLEERLGNAAQTEEQRSVMDDVIDPDTHMELDQEPNRRPTPSPTLERIAPDSSSKQRIANDDDNNDGGTVPSNNDEV